MNSGDKAAEHPWSSQERLRLALDGAQLGLWDGDIATGALYWNDHCYRHFGVTVGEEMSHDRFLSLLELGDRMRAEEAWRQAVAHREDFRVDYRVSWPDASRHWIRAVGRVYFDGDGQPVRVSGITIDVTRQKQAELEIQVLNLGLEERIQARTAELAAEIAARRRLEQRLRLSEALARQQLAEIQAYYDNAPVGLFVLDTALRFLRINEHLAGLHGQPVTDHLGQTIRDMVPGIADQVEPLFRHILQTGTPALNVQIRETTDHQAGDQRDWRGCYHPLRDPAGEIVGLTGMVEEVTALKQAERQLRASEQRYRELSANLEQMVEERTAEIRAAHTALGESEERFRRLFQDTRQPLSLIEDGHFIATNPATLAMLRLERPEQLLGLAPGDFSPPCQPDGQASAAKAAEMMRLASEHGAHEFEWEHLRADGERFPAIILLTAISARHQTLLHVVWRDITEQKRAQQQISYLAYYDALTGLPNRTLGLDRLAQKVAQAQRHQRSLALLYLDLDRFKHVNDHYGHHLGDRLLQQLGRRLSRGLRAEDSLCRLAADEFMLVLPEVRGERSLADLASLCERLLALGSEPFDLDGRQVYADLSIGVALYPRDGADGETLMRHADTALHVAKGAGRQTYRFYEPGMNAALTRFIQTREALRDALERQEFVLHYQPQIDLHSGRLVGFEALVRWRRPTVGLVMPAEFIDVAEQSGLIVPLGHWVLTTACRQAATWRASGWPDLVVAVNVSAVQFRRARIGAEVLAVLEETGLAPAGLEVELTESLLLEGQEAALATVAQWQARGIQLAIDDFGTGYSSLAYLRRFAVDKLKIDQSFIAGMADHDADRAIVQAIIDMARGLKLRTLAEGVDEALLASQLRFMGCDEAQGYLYAPPLAAEDLERWLRERPAS